MICQKWIDEVGYLSSLGNVLLEREKIPWKYYDLYGIRHRLTLVDTREKVDFVKISGKGVISCLKILTVLSRVEVV